MKMHLKCRMRNNGHFVYPGREELMYVLVSVSWKKINRTTMIMKDSHAVVDLTSVIILVAHSFEFNESHGVGYKMHYDFQTNPYW